MRHFSWALVSGTQQPRVGFVLSLIVVADQESNIGGGMEIAFLAGAILLGGCLFYFGSLQGRPSRAERKKGDAAARENWGKEEIH